MVLNNLYTCTCTAVLLLQVVLVNTKPIRGRPFEDAGPIGLHQNYMYGLKRQPLLTKPNLLYPYMYAYVCTCMRMFVHSHPTSPICSKTHTIPSQTLPEVELNNHAPCTQQSHRCNGYTLRPNSQTPDRFETRWLALKLAVHF